MGVPIFDHTLYKYYNNQTANKGKITNSIKDHDNSVEGDFDLIWFDLLCLTPLSAIFQLYHGDQF